VRVVAIAVAVRLQQVGLFDHAALQLIAVSSKPIPMMATMLGWLVPRSGEHEHAGEDRVAHERESIGGGQIVVSLLFTPMRQDSPMSCGA
jgi:hypothetical protein